jgi:hypothetical protein
MGIYRRLRSFGRYRGIIGLAFQTDEVDVIAL